MVPVGLDRFAGHWDLATDFCVSTKKHVFSDAKEISKKHVSAQGCMRNICRSKERKTWINFQRKLGAEIFAGEFSFQMIFSTQKFLAVVQRRLLSARSSAARTVETMPPRKWKQMWWCGWTLRSQWNLASPDLPCKQACCGVSCLWLFRFGYIPNESQVAYDVI